MPSGPWTGGTAPPPTDRIAANTPASYAGYPSKGARVPSRFFTNTGMPTVWPSTVSVRASSLYIETVSLLRQSTNRRFAASSRTSSRTER